MLTKGEIKDPRISSISLTGIKVSDDMGYAKVFFKPLFDDADKEEILEGLQSATGHIKTKLSKRLRVKRIPKIEFEYDQFIDKSQKLDQIIKKNVKN